MANDTPLSPSQSIPRPIRSTTESSEVYLFVAAVPLASKKYPGYVAIIDIEDVEIVAPYRWQVAHNGNTRYATTQVDGKTIYMHRLITGADRGVSVDHVNHDGLDNRKANLRLCSHQNNLRNRVLARDNSTGYVGVEKTRHGRYRAQVWDKGKRVHSSNHETPEDAALARDEAARELYGEYGTYNFPLPGERGVQ